MARDVARVRLPGTDGLSLEREGDDSFRWSVASPATAELEQVEERARSRLREVEEAIELWDHWLAHGSDSASSARQDELLDSRIAYAAERRLLVEFLGWARTRR